MGTVDVELTEAVLDISTKSDRSLFVTITLDAESQNTSLAARSTNPVWDWEGTFPVENGEAKLVFCVHEKRKKSNRALFSATCPLSRIGGGGFRDWLPLTPASKKSKGESRLHVAIRLKMSGLTQLFTAVSAEHEVLEDEEKDTLKTLVKNGPPLLRAIRIAASRVVYVLEPVLVFKMQATKLLLWRSRAASFCTFWVLLYAIVMNQIAAIVWFGGGAVMVWSGMSAMRGVTYVVSTSFSDEAITDVSDEIKDRTRLGAKKSVLADLRLLLTLLDWVSKMGDDVRLAAGEPRTAFGVGGAMIVCGLISCVVQVRTLASFVFHAAALIGLVYAFVLFPLYHHFPLFRERYAPKRLVAALLRLAGRGSTTHVRAPSKDLNQMFTILCRMSAEGVGVPIKDRIVTEGPKKRDRQLVTRCFVAKEGVDWLYTHAGGMTKRGAAFSLFRAFIRQGAVQLAYNSTKPATIAKKPSSQTALRRRSVTQSVDLVDTPDKQPKHRRNTMVDGLIDGAVEKEAHLMLIDSDTQLWRFNEAMIHVWRAKLDVSVSDLATAAEKIAEDSSLTERDWTILLTGATRMSFSSGEVIIEQGSNNHSIFRIFQGDCRVERAEKDAVVTLAVVGPETMLGELSALDSRMRATARVVAVGDVLMDVLRVSFLSSLFDTEPALCRRFFHTVALRLADRLDAFSAPAAKKSDAPSNAKKLGNTVAALMGKAGMINTASQAKTPDERFRRTFRIADDFVICEHPAEHAFRIGHATGQLFITQRYMGFVARSFGRDRKVLVAYRDIKTASLSTSDMTRLKIKIRSGKTLKFGLVDVATSTAVLNIVAGLLADREPDDDAQDDTSTSAVEVVDEVVTETMLTAEDWTTILAVSYVALYKDGESVFVEGEVPVGIVQVEKGRVAIRKGGKQVGEVEHGKVLGEISFLRNAAATADVVAVGEVVVHVIPSIRLRELFVQSPALSGRWLHFLALTLVDRITERATKK